LLDEDFLTRYEKFLLKRGLRTYKRAKALDDAMCIVLNQPDEKEAVREAYRENLIASIKAYPAALQGVVQNPFQNVAGQNSTDARAVYQSADTYK
jgi:dihydroorotase